jgi:lambda family phage tail tape measure protein
MSATRQILIKVVTDGDKSLQNLSRQLGNLNKEAKGMASSAGMLQGALGGIFAGIGIIGITQMADSMQMMSDRMKVFAKEGDDTNAMFYKLVAAANLTRTSVDSLGQIYNRLTISMSALNISSDAILATTMALQNTFRLSGSSIAEATGAAIQLSQGLSSGQLRGQELRSVLEANGVMAQLLAKHFNVSTGALMKLAEAGKITNKEVLTIMADNFLDLAKKASMMKVTFEQAGVMLKNSIGVRIKELNDQLGISSGFAKGVEFLIKNLWLLEVAITALAVSAIPKLISVVFSLGGALFATGIGPWLMLIGLATGIVFNLEKAINSLKIAMLSLTIELFKVKTNSSDASGFLKFLTDVTGGAGDAALRAAEAYAELNLVLQKTKVSKESLESKNNRGIVDSLMPDFENFNSGVLKQNQSVMLFNDGRKAMVQANDWAADSNKELLDGLEQTKAALVGKDPYAIELEKLSKSLKDAAKNAKELKIEKEKIEKTGKHGSDQNDLLLLNLQYSLGTFNLREYGQALENLKLDEINEKFAMGKITVMEYHDQIVKTKDAVDDSAWISGVDGYLRASGTLAQNIAGMITQVFNRLEDVLFDFIKTGTFEFHKFTQAILDDLLRIIIRATIIRPLAQGVLGAFTSGATPAASGSSDLSTGQSVNVAAKGKAFNSGIEMFARGGLVNSPTLFSYGGGKPAMMGEAGTEAILPLKRGKNGNLGVESSGNSSNVVVNVINQSSDTQTETRESTGGDGSRIIDVLIIQKTKDALAKGVFDKDFSAMYGLRRRGT